MKLKCKTRAQSNTTLRKLCVDFVESDTQKPGRFETNGWFRHANAVWHNSAAPFHSFNRCVDTILLIFYWNSLQFLTDDEYLIVLVVILIDNWVPYYSGFDISAMALEMDGWTKWNIWGDFFYHQLHQSVMFIIQIKSNNEEWFEHKMSIPFRPGSTLEWKPKRCIKYCCKYVYTYVYDSMVIACPHCRWRFWRQILDGMTVANDKFIGKHSHQMGIDKKWKRISILTLLMGWTIWYGDL